MRTARMLLLTALAAVVSGCGSDDPPVTAAPPPPDVQCSDTLRPYKNKCLTDMAIVYVECTEGRGVSTTTEIDSEAKGTLRVVTNASLRLSYKGTTVEDTPVAMQIVKDCMEIARASGAAADPERQIAGDFLRDWQAKVDQTPTLSLSRRSGRPGDQVTVRGTNFGPTEMIDIYFHAAIIDQVRADRSGRFSVTVTVPSHGQLEFSTTIRAIGQTSQRSAHAPFHSLPES